MLKCSNAAGYRHIRVDGKGIFMAIPPQDTEVVDIQQQANPTYQKDVWDKLSAISVFVSGVFFAAIGGIFTYLHQEAESQRNVALKDHETKLAEVTIFEKFIPYLKGSSEDLGIAVLGISSLDDELGAKLLGHFARYGTPQQQDFANHQIDQRAIQFINTWNIDGVEQDRSRFPAYLKGTAAEQRCSAFEEKVGAHRRLPANFTTTQPYFIREISNYHWNNGCGSDGKRLTTTGPAGELPATIGLRDKNGVEFGPWKVEFYHQKSPENVDINVDWIATPNIILPANTYEITDSDADTWSYNQQSGLVGISIVKGFSLK